MSVVVLAVITTPKANTQHNATFGTLGLGCCREANPQQILWPHSGDLLARFLVGRKVPRLWVGRL